MILLNMNICLLKLHIFKYYILFNTIRDVSELKSYYIILICNIETKQSLAIMTPLL